MTAIDFMTGEGLGGYLPNKAMSMVQEWTGIHKEELKEIWENDIRVNSPFNGLISFSDATELWGLNEIALDKAVAYGKLVNGGAICKFGKQWIVSIEVMKRAYGVLDR